MNPNQLQDLAGRIEAAPEFDTDLAEAVLEGLRTALPEASADLGSGVVESTDAALRVVVATLPAWSIALEGTASDRGRWACTLRRSGARDDEEVIGIGRAPTPPLALIVALLRVVIARAKGYD